MTETSNPETLMLIVTNIILGCLTLFILGMISAFVVGAVFNRLRSRLRAREHMPDHHAISTGISRLRMRESLHLTS
jgi:hypothetical protein